jgi:RNA polymerase sigma-70 factor (ECF subfamily)
MQSGQNHPDRERSFHEEALPQMEAVFRFALRLTSDPDQPEDLVQDTFLRGEERRKRHDDVVAIEAETDPRRLSREAVVFAAIRDHDPEGAFWRHIVDADVVGAIDALPDPFRGAVVLSDVEDLSYDEISEILDVPVGTVKSRLFRGRRILQETRYERAVESGIIRPTSPRS